MQRHRPLSLCDTIDLPKFDEEPSEGNLITGFVHLITLFKPFDDAFVKLWNKAASGCTPLWLTNIQNQLSEALPEYLTGLETQAVDLETSRQWLRVMVWQLSISHGFLSSQATDPSMTFKYPMEISRELGAAAALFSKHAMEVHGIGLVSLAFSPRGPRNNMC